MPMPVIYAGALPTPRNRLAAAMPFTMPRGLIGAPPSYATVPTQMDIWGNGTWGCCVTSEECFALDAWSTANGYGPIVVATAEVKRWAKAHGVLNGAVIEDVLKYRQKDPLNGPDGKAYTDGPHLSVDYTDETVLDAAIFLSKAVKVGVASGPLATALNQTNGDSGWVIQGASLHTNYDHCVSLCGYGPANDLFEALKLPLPKGLTASTLGNLLFTWNSIGFVDTQSRNNLLCEGWSRSPGINELPAKDPAPTPTPDPSPGPAVWTYPVDGTYSINGGDIVLNLKINNPAPTP